MNAPYGQYGWNPASAFYNAGYSTSSWLWGTGGSAQSAPPADPYDEYQLNQIYTDSDTGLREPLPSSHGQKSPKPKPGTSMSPGTAHTPKSFLAQNWPYLLVGAAVLAAGVGAATWKPKRRNNPKRKKIGFVRGILGLGLSTLGGAMIAFPDPTPFIGPSSWVGWPLLIGGLAVWDIKVIPGSGSP